MQAIFFLTHQCNLNCSYCYQSFDTPVHMSKLTLERAVDFAFAQDSGPVGIGFFGGEPWLRFPMLQHGIEYARTLADASGRAVAFTIATNGTRITPQDARWLMEHPVKIQVSLDGPPEVHNSHRVDGSGRRTFPLTIEGLARLTAQDIPVEVIAVTTPETVSMLSRSIRWLIRDLGIPRVFLNVAYNQNWTLATLSEFETQVRKLEQVILEEYRNGRSLVFDFFDEKIDAALNPERPHLRRCHFGRGKVAVDVDGSVYPCDRLVSPHNYRLRIGHVNSGIDVDIVAGYQRQLDIAERLANDYRMRTGCGCVNLESSGELGQPADTVLHVESLRIRTADHLAQTLFDEANAAFLERFYSS